MKEPWKHDKNRIWAGGEAVCLLYGDKSSESKANAARIVACVNAMAGMDDPEAVMKIVRELFDCVEQNDQKGILAKATRLWFQMRGQWK